MQSITAYRIVCALLGALLVLGGLAFVFAFFRYHMPGGVSIEPLVVGPNGIYFVAFTGCALVGWGGGLLGAARHPAGSRTLGTATAVALVLSALYRLLAWLSGDYHLLGQLPRIEAAIMLALALAFVWLRPPHPAADAAPGTVG